MCKLSMDAAEKLKLNEEIIFWESNMFGICILNRLPEQVPDNDAVKELLAHLSEERDYHAVAERIAQLKKQLRNKYAL